MRMSAYANCDRAEEHFRVQDVKSMSARAVIVTFDPRKTHPPDLHDASKSGYNLPRLRIDRR